MADEKKKLTTEEANAVAGGVSNMTFETTKRDKRLYDKRMNRADPTPVKSDIGTTADENGLP